MLTAPESLREEHEEILNSLRACSKLRDGTGRSIVRVLRVLEPHLKKENELAMPILGSLAELVSSKNVSRMKLQELDELREAFLIEYKTMFEEHSDLRSLISEAKQHAYKEKHRDVADLLDALALHARIEEEVLYPAALIVGTHARYLLQRSEKMSPEIRPAHLLQNLE